MRSFFTRPRRISGAFLVLSMAFLGICYGDLAGNDGPWYLYALWAALWWGLVFYGIRLIERKAQREVAEMLQGQAAAAIEVDSHDADGLSRAATLASIYAEN